MSTEFTSEDIEDTDGEFDEEFEETTTIKTNKNSLDKPVANAEEIPMFANANKRGLNTATCIRVIKLDQPNAGYKGEVPLSSTEETIANLFGNGIYKFELCNQAKKVLRFIDNVRIAIPETKTNSNDTSHNSTDANAHIAAIIKSNHLLHREDRDNLKTILQKGADDAKELALAHTSLVVKTTESAAERERAFMTGINEQQRDWFQQMMLSQNQMFQQTITLLTAGHSMTMEQLRAVSEREREQNNPAVLLSLFMKGMEMGRGMDDDREPWERGIESAVSGLDKLLQLKQNHLPVPKVEAVTKPVKSNPIPTDKTNKVSKVTRQEVKELIELKEILRGRGIDLEQMLAQSKRHYAEVSDKELFGNIDNSSDENPETIEESSKTDLDG